jgi:hypothetical protein
MRMFDIFQHGEKIYRNIMEVTTSNKNKQQQDAKNNDEL